MDKKYKCFWCNKGFLDLEKHTKNMHPELSARSYDYILNGSSQIIKETSHD